MNTDAFLPFAAVLLVIVLRAALAVGLTAGAMMAA